VELGLGGLEEVLLIYELSSNVERQITRSTAHSSWGGAVRCVARPLSCTTK
jgi:hypothetical protein